jgi:hypothetical protein
LANLIVTSVIKRHRQANLRERKLANKGSDFALSKKRVLTSMSALFCKNVRSAVNKMDQTMKTVAKIHLVLTFARVQMVKL